MNLAEQLVISLVCHEVGDYCLQSDWQAAEKTQPGNRGFVSTAVHVVCYTLPFLIITRNPLALLFIAATHFVIDHWRLARFVCWAKNFISPRQSVITEFVPAHRQPMPVAEVSSTGTPRAPHDDVMTRTVTWWYPWAECSKTGYPPNKPDWMAVWLMIRADACMHYVCNFSILWMAYGR